MKNIRVVLIALLTGLMPPAFAKNDATPLNEAEFVTQTRNLGALARTFEAEAPSFAGWLRHQEEILVRSTELDTTAIPADESAAILRETRNQLRAVNEAAALKREHLELARTHPQQVFNVRDYGAVGDGVANDAPAIRAAIDAALPHPHARVHLPAGTYRLGDLDPRILDVPSPCFDEADPGGLTPRELSVINGKPHLFIHRADHLTLSGDGADKTLLLLGVDWETGLDIQSSRDFTLADLAIDYERTPFTQGRVLRVIDEKTYEVTVDKGYPSPLDRHIRHARFGMVTRNFVDCDDSIVPLPARGAPSYLTLGNIERVSDGVYRFTIGSSGVHASTPARARELPVDSRFVLYGRVSNERPAIKLDDVRNATLSRVAIHGSFSAGVLIKRSGLVELDTCQIVPRPGTDRINSTNADGVFGQSNYLSPYIHHTRMTLNGDDFINTHSNALVIERHEGRTLVARVSGHSHFRPGQLVTVVEPGTWRRKYTGIIEKASIQKSGNAFFFTLELDRPVPADVRANRPLAAGERPDRLLNLDVTGPGAVVTDNDLHHSFRLILRSANALVAGNRLHNRHNPGNFIILGVHSLEAWKADNITIRDNVIDSLGNIFLAPQGPAPNRNLLLRENTILNPVIASDPDVFPTKLFGSELNQDVTLRGNIYKSAAP